MSTTSSGWPETLRDGRYRLVEPLGSGGMATVFLAEDTELKQKRAIKLASSHAPESIRKRLRDEARAMATLDHPHVVQIFDVGHEGDVDFIVMERLERSLADRVFEEGSIPVEEGLRIAIQVLSALAAAHARGIVHRDVKPHNILLDEDGNARLADFGIALVSTDTQRQTRTGAMMGSMAFMAPEQRLDARSVGPAADVYAVGTSLYQVVTGRSPVDLFTAETDSERWGDLPEGLWKAIYRATRLSPHERYVDAAALAADLTRLLGGESVTLSLPVVASLGDASTLMATQEVQTLAAAETLVEEPAPSRRGWLAAIVLLVAVGISGIAVAVWTPPETPSSAPVAIAEPQPAPARVPVREADVPQPEAPTISGVWTGEWNGRTVRMTLRGETELEGHVAIELGDKQSRMAVVGTVEDDRVSLEDVEERADSGRYQLRLDGDRLVGSFERRLGGTVPLELHR